MRKFILILFCILGLSISSFAQSDSTWTPEKGQKYCHYIGLGGGGTTGFGLTYKYMPKNYGIMFSVAPYYSKADNEALLSGGITLEKVIARNYSNALFIYLSNSVLYNKNMEYLYEDYSYQYSNSYTNQHTTQEHLYWNSGFGLGLEVHSSKRIVLNAMIGYAQYDSFSTVFLTGEFFVFYRFN